MKELYSDKSEDERTEIARKTYFDSILQYIKENPNVINKKVINYFESIKDKYRLALITTNTKSALERILSLTNIKIFDIIETSRPEEKDDKKIVFNRFIDKNGKPLLYIGGGREDSYDYCSKKNIRIIYANLEGEEDIESVKTIHNLQELKSEIENF